MISCVSTHPAVQGARPPGQDGRALATGLLAGVVADAMLGDPRHGHPVALFGRWATAIEHAIYADSRARGAGFTACCVAIATVPALAGSRLARRHPAAGLIMSASCTWAVTAARSLTSEAELIRRALVDGDIDRARRRLPSLCGRDPDLLDAAGIARAVVESVAENTSDAIVAPLLWGALAGPAGLTGYRAVNTLDAMVGHRSPRYERFGWASARLDDIANWTPSRLTAILAAALAPVVAGQPTSAWRAAQRDGPRHPSPNAGWCEAAFAGALGVRLGGTLSYAGRVERRPELGTGHPPGPADIARAIRLCHAVTAGAACVTAGLALLGSELRQQEGACDER
jgi:adenosylcobinamide-phosphate synthase